MTAPIDALYAATEVNEWAWEATAATLNDWTEPDLAQAARKLRRVITAELNPHLVALRDAARQRGVCFLSDDDEASVGMGCGSLTWSVDSLPEANEVPWDRVHDVPLALVTGSNGKTTTVRLLAAIMSAEGHVPGYSSTDGIYVGGELVDADDWSGPGGGRLVLRDRRVEVAVLETARGGMLRRGLAVARADAAIVTNVAADHLGEWGVHDIEAIADAKLVVARAVRDNGTLALNADDPVLVRRAERLGVVPTWFAVDGQAAAVRAHLDRGGDAAVVESGEFIVYESGGREAVVDVAAVPLTFDGAARYNVENVLGAIAVARGLDVGLDPIRAAVLSFGGPEDNPGRGNLFELGEVRVLVDFAHNPHGMTALAEMAGALPAERRLLILGQAGDRDDESIGALARAAVRLGPDRIIIKELHRYLRGRKEGEVPQLLEEELRRAGYSADRISRATTEIDAVRAALDWARPKDLLIFPLHTHREEVLHLLESLAQQNWQPITS
jgi:cyanophycin synthetase